MQSASLPSFKDLADRYYAADDPTRKNASYLDTYTEILAARRMEPLTLLEIGVFSGASLLCWRDFLPNATIVGIDIAEPPARILGQERIHFVRGSQDDPAVLDKAANLAGGHFDMIVDDASHVGYLTKRSLHYLFPRWLVPGGWYVIEDIGASFLPHYPDGIAYSAPAWDDAQPDTREFHSSRFGMVGVVKQLIDLILHEVMTGERSYLPIRRLMVENNIAFIEKAMVDGAPWPGYIPFMTQPPPAEPAIPPAVAASLDELAAKVDALGQRVLDTEHKIGTYERVIGPFRRLRRAFRG